MLWILGIALFPAISLAGFVLLLREALVVLPWPFVQPELVLWFFLAGVVPLGAFTAGAWALTVGAREAQSDAEPDPLEIFRR